LVTVRGEQFARTLARKFDSFSLGELVDPQPIIPAMAVDAKRQEMLSWRFAFLYFAGKKRDGTNHATLPSSFTVWHLVDSHQYIDICT
jgi:hypothetical protein